MPDRLRARAALTALLVLLAAAGIHAAGPAVAWGHPARHVVITIGVVVEVVLAGLLVALHRRTAAQREMQDARRTGIGRPAPSGSRRPALSRSEHAARNESEPAADDLGAKLAVYINGALVAGLVAIPVAILLASVRPITRRRQVPAPVPLPSRGGRLSAHGGRADGGGISLALLQELLIAVLLAVLLAALIAIAIRAWRRYRARRPRSDVPLAEQTDTPADLARAVESGRVALREVDDARAAIIACYAAMEESLADAGAARTVAETPDELLARAVAAELVSGAPAGRLTGLFYEARFSTHPMPRSQRDDAEGALAELEATR
jgi:hypothetical protein